MRTIALPIAPNRRGSAVLGALALLLTAISLAALAATGARSQSAIAEVADGQGVAILFARERKERAPPLSLLDLPPADDGLAGGRLAILDNNTTGRFTKQSFVLAAVEDSDPAALAAKVAEKIAAGTGLVILAAEPATLLAIADAHRGAPVLLFNAGSPEDRLREEDCRRNLLHVAPTRSMLADALGQYLVWKQWRRWFLVSGPQDEDKAFAEALRRAANRFGARIVEERAFADEPGSRRSDGGYEQIQQQIPLFTQNVAAHDVVLVADESNLFGEYLPYRTWDARLVAGTAGLVPTIWHPAFEQWGATQLQNRFRRLAGRAMRPLDYGVWMAVRAIGEAATRRRSVNPVIIAEYLRSADFELAAFKGQRLTFRAWNGQLRQPIIVGTAKLPVTVSPQPGFLHQVSELDTLGVDKPETRCKVVP